MKIWKYDFDLKTVNDRSKNTLAELIGIEFFEYGDDFMKARMPVNHRVHQPIGIMHGGASCVLAETVGSTAAQFCINFDNYYCVGLDINTNHIRSIRSGEVIATAKPYHLGKSTQVWSIEIHDQEDRLISINRLTMAVLARAQV